MEWAALAATTSIILTIVGALLFLSRSDLRNQTLKEVESEAAKLAMDSILKDENKQRKIRDEFKGHRDFYNGSWDQLRKRGEDKTSPETNPVLLAIRRRNRRKGPFPEND